MALKILQVETYPDHYKVYFRDKICYPSETLVSLIKKKLKIKETIYGAKQEYNCMTQQGILYMATVKEGILIASNGEFFVSWEN